jgi:hypothetical protein
VSLTGMLGGSVIQSQAAQAKARLSAARAFLLGSLQEITAKVARVGDITLDQRMVIRLASTCAIHQSLQVVDTAYHAAGSTAIFEQNPFESRFRDIHTVSQQVQGRLEHFKTVGQYLLGLDPDSTMWLRNRGSSNQRLLLVRTGSLFGSPIDFRLGSRIIPQKSAKIRSTQY